MKKFTLGLFGLLFVTGITAQTATKTSSSATTTPSTTSNQPVSNCYTRWEDKFEERGAWDVKDGTHDSIIITVRSGPAAQCYSGKVDVKDGKITAMYRKLADNTYEVYKPKLKYQVAVTIVNGVSTTMLTVDDELVNVIFPNTLKPKKVAYTTAPDPPQD